MGHLLVKRRRRKRRRMSEGFEGPGFVRIKYCDADLSVSPRIGAYLSEG